MVALRFEMLDLVEKFQRNLFDSHNKFGLVLTDWLWRIGQ
jgi:hypothetical protein